MTDPSRHNDEPGAPVQAPDPVVSKPYIMPDDPEDGSLEALAKEAAESRDKMLRTLAEMENLRKRTSREVSDARIYGITGFARDVLDIADNLQRALDAVPADTRASADPGLKALIEGVELTERSLLNALEDLERVRLLFDDLETKRGVIDLLGRAERAEGVRIFIGSENKLFSLSGSSTIIAPYSDGAGHIVGVLGVIGPTRLNYARVIPTVDYAARIVSQMLGG